MRFEAPMPIVRRIQTADGSHIVPPLDQSWSASAKLRWHAAVVECDTGIRTRVSESGAGFCVEFGRVSAAEYDFGTAWAYLSGCRTGQEAS